MTHRATQRQEQKAETRQRILDEAARLFAEGGFAGTRTADVAAATGLSHGAVFVHFPTREALLLEVVFALGRRLTDQLHAAVSYGLREALITHVKVLSEEEAVSHHILERADPNHMKDVPVHILFNTWIGLVHHYLMNRELFAPKGGVLKKHGRALVEHYLKLVRRMS
jgi:AcrR family transcriptional regulator